MSRSRNPPPRGQGAARAKQMGLLLDLSPDGGMDDEGNDDELEAELLNLVGGRKEGRAQGKKGDGRAPVPMAEIERMAALCMKDIDDDDMGDDDLDDEDLLAELNDVLEDDEEHTPAPTPPASRLLERIEMYQTAISNAKAAGETSKVRRYERGLKTLQSMLTSAKKGKPVNEEEMPPPVALGGKSDSPTQPEVVKEREVPKPVLVPPPPTNQKPLREADPTPLNTKPTRLIPPQKQAAAMTPETPAISPLTPKAKQAVLTRQRDYKMAAIHAKQSGNIDQAKQHYLTAKNFDVILEALDRGEPVDLSSLPPPPGQWLKENVNLPAPKSLAEALQQRLDIYKSAAEGAKSKGDDRKARMHQRIMKQYQDAIKAHKAGRPVNLSDLPVPPGCPPLQGTEGGQQNFMGVLETAMKIANQDADAEDEEEDGHEEAAKVKRRMGGKNKFRDSQQQLDFLLLRRQAFMRAALRSKNMKDMTGAAQHLRHAKGLDAMITAAKSGLPVDITKTNNSCSLFCCPRLRYVLSLTHTTRPLLFSLHEQKCLGLSQQFTNTGNVAEALKSEKLLEETMKYIEILKSAYTKGHPVPKCRTEERTFNSIKINPNLTLNDLILYVTRGINLPAPSGVSANDLDASVKFEFPFPSAEEAQRDKTNTVKNTSSPEFKETFRLNINRGHRAFKRVIQSKGIKFEIIHKGGLFKNDKVLGTAQLKLEGLENHCEIREILEVMDGRKTTGGKLEVRVKIREPLSGVELHPVKEKWLTLEPVSTSDQPASPRSKPKHEASSRSGHSSSSPPQYKLHSFSLLNYDKERLERKVVLRVHAARRETPSDLIHQHQEVTHRLQWQKAQLERASPAMLTEQSRSSKYWLIAAHSSITSPSLGSPLQPRIVSAKWNSFCHFCSVYHNIRY
uniref:Coiled-coil and C2 domain-containing protein 1B n=1 Tax=Astatotilapia calliptera TaxID=8154 RepID=A0AAX7SQ04_ASTCA